MAPPWPMAGGYPWPDGGGVPLAGAGGVDLDTLAAILADPARIAEPPALAIASAATSTAQWCRSYRGSVFVHRAAPCITRSTAPPWRTRYATPQPRRGD